MALQFASLSAHYTRSEILLFVYVLAYIAVAYLASLIAGHAGDFSLFIYPGVMIEIGVPLAVLVLCARMVFIMVHVRPQNLFLCIASDLRDRVFTRQRAIKSLPVVFVLVFFISTYTSMKSMIPVFHDYDWDETFMRLDRFLHFGWHPWQLLEPVLHEPVVTYVINVGYNAWFLVVLSVLYWQVFTVGNPFLRMRFLWVFVVSWTLGGNVLASLFASTGPCFYDSFVDGHNPYAALMQYLHQADQSFDIWALDTQEALLEAHMEDGVGVGSGISAMPSMHVASATLFALVGLRAQRVLGWLLVLYTLLIYVGSVHLAWHYAVDGIAGVVFIVLLWWAAGRFLRKDAALMQASQHITAPDPVAHPSVK